MSEIKSPFSDAVGPDSVPKRGSSGGKYDAKPMSDVPGRDGSGVVAELTFDTTVGKSPSTSGSLKTPFKDAVD